MIQKPEISVLMPTYNDSKYIATAIQSVLNQNYKKWELIIVDDKSTDNTPEIINSFDDDRITYLRLDKNSGQLNALMKGAEYIKGEYITFLHSDDAFVDDNVLKRNVSAMTKNDCEGIFGNLVKMNENGESQGLAKTADAVETASPAVLFLRGGSNMISDVFFVRKTVFNNVLSNYITWNMPYWLKFHDTRVDVLNLLKVCPWYKYRVYPENYMRSDIGKFEVLNGCLRSIIEIGKRIEFPLLKIQRTFSRIFRARSKPLFKTSPCSPQHIREMVAYLLQQFYRKTPQNIYFKGLLGFYSNYPSNHTIKLKFKKEEKIFLGKDARIFFNLMENHCLPEVYKYVLEEATQSFGTVIVTCNEDYKKAKDVMKFLNLIAKIERE